jgi:hypothetical protein
VVYCFCDYPQFRTTEKHPVFFLFRFERTSPRHSFYASIPFSFRQITPPRNPLCVVFIFFLILHFPYFETLPTRQPFPTTTLRTYSTDHYPFLDPPLPLFRRYPHDIPHERFIIRSRTSTLASILSRTTTFPSRPRRFSQTCQRIRWCILSRRSGRSSKRNQVILR